MYDSKTQLLIENPNHRYLINSPMPPDLEKNADGSIPRPCGGPGEWPSRERPPGRRDYRAAAVEAGPPRCGP